MREILVIAPLFMSTQARYCLARHDIGALLAPHALAATSCSLRFGRPRALLPIAESSELTGFNGSALRLTNTCLETLGSQPLAGVVGLLAPGIAERDVFAAGMASFVGPFRGTVT